MRTQGGLQIDSSHCRAICEEIGDRLRIMLAREMSTMPLHLQLLLDRLSEQEHGPSIAPSLHDMVWPEALVPERSVGWTNQ
ncbi:MAG: hypothetical protein ACJ8EF_11150 [Bradyrhizobium sp.]|jgi:hypothetical protein